MPSVTGPDPHGSPPRSYGLPPLVNLAALEAEITAAMSGGTVVTVDLPGPSQNGAPALPLGLHRADMPVRDWCSWNGSRATGSGRRPRSLAAR